MNGCCSINGNKRRKIRRTKTAPEQRFIRRIFLNNLYSIVTAAMPASGAGQAVCQTAPSKNGNLFRWYLSYKIYICHLATHIVQTDVPGRC